MVRRKTCRSTRTQHPDSEPTSLCLILFYNLWFHLTRALMHDMLHSKRACQLLHHWCGSHFLSYTSINSISITFKFYLRFMMCTVCFKKKIGIVVHVYHITLYKLIPFPQILIHFLLLTAVHRQCLLIPIHCPCKIIQH